MIVDGNGLPGGVPIAVQAAADGQIASAKDQGVFALVVERTFAQIHFSLETRHPIQTHTMLEKTMEKTITMHYKVIGAKLTVGKNHLAISDKQPT